MTYKPLSALILTRYLLTVYARLGPAWATTLLALLCLALTPFPFLFKAKGAKYRKASKYGFSD